MPAGPLAPGIDGPIQLILLRFFPPFLLLFNIDSKGFSCGHFGGTERPSKVSQFLPDGGGRIDAQCGPIGEANENSIF